MNKNLCKLIIFFIAYSNISFAQVHEKNHIEWSISLSKIEGDSLKYLLTSEFTSNYDSEELLCIVPMMKTLPITTELYTMDSILLTKVDILDYYLAKFPLSQYLIENDIGDFETFSFNTKMPRTANYIIHSQYGAQEVLDFDFFSLTPYRTITIGEIISLKQLKLIEGKEKIRLHYLFKEDNHDIDSFTLTSNWIDLPNSN